MDFSTRARQLINEAESQSTHTQYMSKISSEIKTFSLILMIVAKKWNIENIVACILWKIDKKSSITNRALKKWMQNLVIILFMKRTKGLHGL